jgi:RNA polymerase sigma-70 factor, ECF subfamily
VRDVPDAFGVGAAAVRDERVLLEIDASPPTGVANEIARLDGPRHRPLDSPSVRLRAVEAERDRYVDRVKVFEVYFHRCHNLAAVRLYSRIESMDSTAEQSKLELFDRHRPRLFAIAYRMLGTRDDAEEIVQEAYIRWHQAAAGEIQSPEAWLVTATTRLSIDRLRKAYMQRETYIGPWLPEPLFDSGQTSPQGDAELASSLSMAFMVMLERLSPAERAVFLLHDVFDLGHAEIARIMEKAEPAVRQMLHRARTRVRTDKPRFHPDPTEHRKLVERFSVAAYTADENALLELFSPDIAVTSDGGGKITAARKIITGLGKVVRLFVVAVAGHADRITRELKEINGEPGIVEFYDGHIFAANTFSSENGKITAIYRVMNPDKLKAIRK